ncbi:glycosyltransferase family 4 protein [Flavobacterium sp. PLA-1-15]|uniref:glycosyltransferase family 4 protein n=1 Tax=Flavobacterium sp. PLA-1-15 TaxID=3380533 RepID=UPI003B79B9A9
MRILYIVPKINNAGGVARVLSVKSDYCIENWNYEITILTQNNGNAPLFYEFNKNVVIEDIQYSQQKIKFFFQFRKHLQEKIDAIKPDRIVVSDNGFKAYLIPFLLKTKIPIIFEAHGSRFNKEKKANGIFQRIGFKFSDAIKKAGAKRFDLFIALSKENLSEWEVKDGVVIPNPIWIESTKDNFLETKKVIAVARHSYEKGLDRLLKIWKEVVKVHPDWELDIYGDSSGQIELFEMAKELKIEQNVNFHLPVLEILEQYEQASIYAMTSRTEGFPMVLLEAMACGLPIIAYDCPVGPRSIITNSVDGFLIKDGDEKLFIQKLLELMNDVNLRKELGKNGTKKIQQYKLEPIMNKWKLLFESVQKKH